MASRSDRWQNAPAMKRLIALFLLACLVALMPPSGAGADDGALARGIEAYRAGDYEAARRLLEPFADQPEVAYALGNMAMEGEGGPVDHEAAARHFAVGAAGGHTGANANLGFLLDRGWGIERNGARAQTHYIIAALQGNVVAMNNLAYLWGRQGGLLPQALCLSARTLEIEPDNASFLDTYGFILLRLKRAAEADRYFRRALQIAPDIAEIWEHRGDAAGLSGGDGSAFWKRALDAQDDGRLTGRVMRKLRGGTIELDLNAHPPFELRGDGFALDCAMPLV